MTYTILDLSTAHIKLSTNEWLESNPQGITSYSKEFGWFIHTACPDPYDSKGIPSELRRLMNFSRNSGHTWLVLDKDGEEDSMFPTYDWDTEIVATDADDVRFPAGLDSYLETFYQMANVIEHQAMDSSTVLYAYRLKHGAMFLASIARVFTFEFEELHKDEQWQDKEWEEEIWKFILQKDKEDKAEQLNNA